MEVNSTAFWVVGIVWFTVPILSWLWSLVSIRYYKNAHILLQELTETLTHIKKIHNESLTYRAEALEIKIKAEEEIKAACNYYKQIADLITTDENNKWN